MNRTEMLDLMRNGWELGVHHGLDTRVSVQQGGQMKGGKVHTVSWTVFEAALKRGEIEEAEKPRHWLTTYRLAASGEPGE